MAILPYLGALLPPCPTSDQVHGLHPEYEAMPGGPGTMDLSLPGPSTQRPVTLA